MKRAASMKPKTKARKSHDDFYSFEAVAKRKAAQYREQVKDTNQAHPREPRHVRGSQLGSSAYMLMALYDMMDAVDAEKYQSDESDGLDL